MVSWSENLEAVVFVRLGCGIRCAGGCEGLYKEVSVHWTPSLVLVSTLRSFERQERLLDAQGEVGEKAAYKLFP